MKHNYYNYNYKIAKNQKTEGAKMEWEKYLNKYENYLRNILGRSENTVKSYCYEIKAFAEWAGKSPCLITRADAENYISELAEKGLAATSRAKRITVLKLFFDYLEEEEYISENPLSRIRKPKIPQKKVKAMSREEMLSVIQVAKNSKRNNSFRNYTMIALLFSTGIRRDELVNIKLDDVNLSENSLLVRVGKGNKQRMVYFNNEAKALLSEYIASHRKLSKYAENSEYLFVSNDSEKLGRSTVNVIVNALFEEAGIKDKGFVLHSTRKYFATGVYDATHDIVVVQNLLGHASPETTMKYIGIEEEMKKKAAQLINF